VGVGHPGFAPGQNLRVLLSNVLILVCDFWEILFMIVIKGFLQINFASVEFVFQTIVLTFAEATLSTSRLL
jgi:hypothetical protein